MSDLAIEFRVKNGRLKRAIFAAGWESYAAFARANHISYQALSNLLGMRQPAFRQDGWRQVAIDVATALHREPEELWPEEMRRHALACNHGEFAVTIDEAARLSAPRVNRLALAQLTKGLRANELKAITAMARGATLDEAGEGVGVEGGNVSRERARQIGMKAIRKMRYRAKALGLTLSDVVEAA